MEDNILDFIAECEAYKYSTEAFLIDQHVSTLVAMAQYAEGKQYFNESVNIDADILSENRIFFSEDEQILLNEAASTFDAANGGMSQRLKNILVRFGKLLAKIIGRSDKLTPKARDCVRILSRREMSTAEMRHIKDILAAADKKRDLFVPYKIQPFSKNFHIIYGENRRSINTGVIQRDLAAVLSDDVVTANVSFIHIDPPINGNTVGVVSFDILVNACTKLIGKNGGPVAAVGEVISGWAQTKQNGLTFRTSSKAIKSEIDALNGLTDKINEVMIERNAQAKANGSAGEMAKTAVMAAAIHKVLIATLGATIRIYNGYMAYRQDVVLNLHAYLSTLVAEG